MSSLQCPATLLLVAVGADRVADRVTGRRVARVWATGPPARDTARVLAEGLGVGVTEPTGTVGTQRLREVLGEVADAHPGETVLVVADGDTLRHSLPSLVQMQVAPAAVGATTVIEVAADADGWVCLAWTDEG